VDGFVFLSTCFIPLDQGGGSSLKRIEMAKAVISSALGGIIGNPHCPRDRILLG